MLTDNSTPFMSTTRADELHGQQEPPVLEGAPEPRPREGVVAAAPKIDMLPTDDSRTVLPPTEEEYAALLKASASFRDIAPRRIPDRHRSPLPLGRGRPRHGGLRQPAPRSGSKPKDLRVGAEGREVPAGEGEVGRSWVGSGGAFGGNRGAGGRPSPSPDRGSGPAEPSRPCPDPQRHAIPARGDFTFGPPLSPPLCGQGAALPVSPSHLVRDAPHHLHSRSCPPPGSAATLRSLADPPGSFRYPRDSGAQPSEESQARAGPSRPPRLADRSAVPRWGFVPVPSLNTFAGWEREVALAGGRRRPAPLTDAESTRGGRPAHPGIIP